ncbi:MULTISPECIES: PepSY-associated TM helix domain-containing protein [Niastella]|uniref:PepSY domain-containing protein n=1 Tax=Niastella soli TaxID=2821487 RepID=A0ABS3YN90_9BACT|nr:PepSY-associated TM helix domain-containing protein [Niastella soli]MBO9199062.1 PepSY domain-containing protein [Niastella soli]
MTLKQIFGKLHLWLGLASGLVVLIVAGTGTLLVFEDELDEWANKDFYTVAVPQNTQRVSVDSMYHAAKAYDSSVKITRIYLESKAPEQTAIFYAKKKKTHTWHIAVNPYTGKVIRAREFDKRFFGVVLNLHRHLCMDEVGKTITHASCLIFVLMIITGLVLWWPKRWKMLKQRTRIAWSSKWKRLNWDLHAVTGFYVHIILLFISLTGLVFAYPWFSNLVYQLADGKPAPKKEAPANTTKAPIKAGFYESLYEQANEKLPYKGRLTILLPEKDSLAITVNKMNREASVDNVTDVLYFEKGTGKLLKESLFKNSSTGNKIRRMNLPIHTGKLFGWPTQLLALIAAIVAFSLPITGFLIYLGRKKKKVKPAIDPIRIGSKKEENAVV